MYHPLAERALRAEYKALDMDGAMAASHHQKLFQQLMASQKEDVPIFTTYETRKAKSTDAKIGESSRILRMSRDTFGNPVVEEEE